MKAEDKKFVEDELLPLVSDESGNSLWDLVSLVPWARHTNDTTILAKNVTLPRAMEMLNAMGMSKGLCPVVLWPSWACFPCDWDMDNETYFHHVQNYYREQTANRLMPPAPQQKVKSSKKRGKKQ